MGNSVSRTFHAIGSLATVKAALVAAFASAATLVTSGAAQAAGPVTTQICLRVTDRHGGTDGDIYANLTGYGHDQPTGLLSLDREGVNDFEVGQWNCFEFLPRDMPLGVDVGHHINLTFGFLKGGDLDDFCIDRLYSRRWENWNPHTRKGDLLTTQQYVVPFSDGREDEVCFGDYGKTKQQRVFVGKYGQPTPTAKIGSVVMRWKEIGSQFGTGTLNFTTTYGATRTEEKTKTSQWEIGVTQTVSVSGKVAGAGVESETSVSVSGGQSYGVGEAVSYSEAVSHSHTCTVSGPETYVWAYQWVVDVIHTDGTLGVKVPLKHFVCIQDNPQPGQFRPVCLPGCCANTSCTSCRDATGCDVIVNPKWHVE